ncbi:metal-dependent hydrolase [Poriferisphaera sp. WC338]|uniref:metal-dependent hydrolase n=1 Tax=Poriferisphaera sp. WC338 TaxID=3425129 RepID=UPI003D81C391
MPLKITFLGHSGFLISDGKHTVAIDPFLTDNPVAVHKHEEIKCDYVCLTHGHADHFGDTLQLAGANDATVVANFEICAYCESMGVRKTEPGNPGGRIYTPFGYVAFTPAIHSSSYEGKYMGVAAGLVLQIGGHKIYHAGDTALFSDMKMIGEVAQPEIAMLPCGDRFTMGPKLARMAAEMIKPKYAVPIHHSTWPLLTSDLSEFHPNGVEVKHMAPGDIWHYEG